MARIYSPEEKAAALQRLAANGGKILLTSRQTGIPDRTLDRWKALRDVQRTPPPPPPQHFSVTPPPPPPTDVATAFLPSEKQPAPLVAETGRALEDDYDSLRQHLVREALTIAASLSQGVHNAPLNQRAIALSRLVDRIVKLDTINPHYPEDDMAIAYDEGYERDTPDHVAQNCVYWGTPPNSYGPFLPDTLPEHIQAQLEREGAMNVHLRLAKSED